MKIIDKSQVTSSHQWILKFKNFKNWQKTFMYELKTIGLTLLSWSMAVMMKMYGGVFFYSNPFEPSNDKRALSPASWFSRNGQLNARPAVNLNVWPPKKLTYLQNGGMFFEAVFLHFFFIFFYAGQILFCWDAKISFLIKKKYLKALYSSDSSFASLSRSIDAAKKNVYRLSLKFYKHGFNFWSLDAVLWVNGKLDTMYR